MRAGYWWIAGILVAVLAGGVMVATHRDHPSADARPTQATAGSPTPPPPPIDRPECRPTVTDRWVDPNGSSFAIVYASRCPEVVRSLMFRVTRRGADGRPVQDAPYDVAIGGVLFPGQEQAAFGTLTPDPGHPKITGIDVAVTDLASQPAADFTAWAHPTVTGLTRSKPDRRGHTTVDGTLQPPGAHLCPSRYVLIARARTGKIVYGWENLAGYPQATTNFDVPPVTGLDLARSSIYVVQSPATAAPPRAGVTCDGRPAT